MNYKHICAAGLFGASSLACAAEPKTSDFYVEAGYIFLNLDAGSELDKDLGVGVLKFGYNAHENLAIEVFAGTGFSDIKKSGGSGLDYESIKIKADSMFGIYVKPKVKLGDAELFGRLGWAHTKLKVKESDSDGPSSSRFKEGDFSFGAGASYSITKQWYVQADYMRYLDKKGVELSGPSISIGYNF